jgi:hypothetical protein
MRQVLLTNAALANEVVLCELTTTGDPPRESFQYTTSLCLDRNSAIAQSSSARVHSDQSSAECENYERYS